MLEFLKKKWVEWLMAIVVVVISSILMNSFMLKRDRTKDIEDSKSKIQEQLRGKASFEYVDKQDNTLKEYINTQDQNIKDNLEQSIEAQTTIIQSMDHKLDILINSK
jgi:cytoskeletal protein RodZ